MIRKFCSKHNLMLIRNHHRTRFPGCGPA